jgi:ABC-type metal ion transport system substrate-binding protein
MQPLTKSIEFDNLCKRLVIISRKKALELKPKPLIKNLKKIGYNNYEIKKINEVNQIFTTGNMPYLIMATIARIFLEEGELLNTKSFKENNRTSKKPKKNYLLLIEQHHANKNLKEIYNSIKSNLGLQFLNTDYRAFARWPSYFEMTWKSFLPTLLSTKYEEKVLEIHNFIIKEALLLPNPKNVKSIQIINAAKKDKKNYEIKKVVQLFQWLLPGLITNVAFMREQIK